MHEAALVVLEVVAPIFAIILMGYLAARRRWIGEAGFAGMNAFTFNLAAPALLFAAGTAGHTGGGLAALAFFLGCGVLYAATIWGARRAGIPLGAAGALGLNVTFGNTVMMGIPLVAAALGQAGLSVLLTILALHAMLLLGMATLVAELAQNSGARPLALLRNMLMGVARNPVVMAVLLALLWRSLDLPVPAAARTTLEMLGAATSPLALFCLGASLTGFAAAGLWAQTGAMVLLKLAALPLLVWGFCRLLGVSEFETSVAVLTAALPTGANAFLLARRYATGADGSGAAVLISTVLSVVTLSALLTLFRAV